MKDGPQGPQPLRIEKSRPIGGKLELTSWGPLYLGLQHESGPLADESNLLLSLLSAQTEKGKDKKERKKKKKKKKFLLI
jgi:hypothetical protein